MLIHLEKPKLLHFDFFCPFLWSSSESPSLSLLLSSAAPSPQGPRIFLFPSSPALSCDPPHLRQSCLPLPGGVRALHCSHVSPVVLRKSVSFTEELLLAASGRICLGWPFERTGEEMLLFINPSCCCNPALAQPLRTAAYMAVLSIPPLPHKLETPSELPRGFETISFMLQNWLLYPWNTYPLLIGLKSFALFVIPHIVLTLLLLHFAWSCCSLHLLVNSSIICWNNGCEMLPTLLFNLTF